MKIDKEMRMHLAFAKWELVEIMAGTRELNDCPELVNIAKRLPGIAWRERQADPPPQHNPPDSEAIEVWWDDGSMEKVFWDNGAWIRYLTDEPVPDDWEFWRVSIEPKPTIHHIREGQLDDGSDAGHFQ